MSSSLANLGLGYSISIALAFLFLLSTLLFISYICLRSSPSISSNTNPSINPDGVTLPRIIFVAESDDDPDPDPENSVMGLNQNVINSYPKFPYQRIMNSTNMSCSICLCEFKESEMLRMMPECRHYFHVCCIDAWLKLNGSCPVCRNSPLPTPVATPLQEVVPLTQYGDDRRRR